MSFRSDRIPSTAVPPLRKFLMSIPSCFARLFASSLLLAVIGSLSFSINAARCEDIGQKFTTLKQARQKAADRPRRIIYNDDGGAVTKNLTNPTVQGVIEAGKVQHLVGSQVDSLFYCSKSSGFGIFTHFTKIGDVFTSKEDIFKLSGMAELVKANIDPLKVMVDFSKQNKIEIFWSMRMNDTHDGSRTDYAPVVFKANRLKNAHPEFLLSTADRRPKHGAWSAVDYTHPEIRDYAFRFIEEVCLNYDIDGIELDFLRHPVFFKSVSRGEPASDDELAAMTAMIERVRTMTETVGLKRGRPILVAIRTFDSAEYSRTIGLDIESWLKKGLLDILITGGYSQLNDFSYTIALGRKYGVKVYPSLDDTRMKDPLAKEQRMSDRAYRARALELWNERADGVYMFNGPSPDSPLFRELGDPKLLVTLDRDSFASIKGIGKSSGGNYPLDEFQKAESLSTNDPKKIDVGEKSTARIRLDGASDKKFDHSTLKLRLRFEKAPAVESVSIKFNDTPLTLKSVDQEWLATEIPTTLAKQGTNIVALTLSKQAASPIVWTDVMIELRVKK